jgi:protein FAM32A
MPAEDYIAAGAGGALKLKGAKVQKAKKKKSKNKDKDKDKSANLESSISSTTADVQSMGQDDSNNIEQVTMPVHESEFEYKTEAERRHEEAMRKKVLAPHTSGVGSYKTKRMGRLTYTPRCNECSKTPPSPQKLEKPIKRG